ncbi:MAG: SpoIIE family protein phosphatase [Armatimonadota bacterium]|nr:SpoIIE family protein phosphatase [bacterium]
MLKGITKAGEGNSPEERYGIVVALSNLSKTMDAADENTAFPAAAEAGATLLRVSKTAVFIRGNDGELTVGGSTGLSHNPGMLSTALEVARESLKSSAPVLHPNSFSKNSDVMVKLKKLGISAVMSVPMRVGEANLGAFVAISEESRTFMPGDVELAHVVASQAALVAWRKKSKPSSNMSIVESDHLISMANRKIQELSLVNQVSDAVSSTLDLEKLLDIALEQSMAAVGADAGSLMLVSEDNRKLEIVASRGIAHKWVKRTKQAVGQSIAGWVAEHGESVLVTNARKDPRFQMPFFRDNIASAASIPLKVKGSIIGVLNVNTLNPDRIFDERDLELLGTVANQMAVAIENARLYARVNRRTKQLDSLLQISRTVTSTLNLDEVLHRVSEEICRVFQLDVCSLLLLDELSGKFKFGHGMGLKTRRKYVYYDIAAPFAHRVKKNGAKLIVRDMSHSRTLKTEFSQAEGLKTAVAIPLKHNGKLIGVAVGFAREMRAFLKSQHDLVRPIGELAGISIRHARIYRQKYRIAEMLQQRLVPEQAPKIAGLDIGHKFLPAHEVGGDYYNFISVGKNKFGIGLGDVSGSDVEAAEYTTMGKHVLRAYAREYSDPADVLMKTNDLVCEDTRSDMFISLFYGVIDLDANRLRYANAGCEPGILYKARQRQCSLLMSEGILLGIKRGTAYEVQEAGLQSGDVLMVYTDGLTEAGVEDQRFGTQRVMDLLSEFAHLDAQSIAERMHDALLEFGHGRITDDVAMVVVKIA